MKTLDYISIIIPSLKSAEDLRDMLKCIEETTVLNNKVIVTGLQASASVNRNHGLEWMGDAKLGIMLDDDVEGFYKGWDQDLVAPFSNDPQLAVISARLMTRGGKPGANCADNYDLGPDYIYVQKKQYSILPTAAIAFKNIGLKFDENFIGSGFEDSDWMFRYLESNKDFKFMINNKCRLIHLNEMKNQKGTYWDHNFKYFNDKYAAKESGKVKVAVMIKTFSGEEWVHPCLKSLYNYVDKIVLVNSDVSWTGEKGNLTKNAITTFRANEDKDNKIVEIECNTTDQIQQCDIGFKYIKDHGYDFAMLVDFDEIWDQTNLQKAFNVLQLNSKFPGAMMCGMRTYIKYPIYRIKPPEPNTPTVFVSTRQKLLVYLVLEA